MDTTFGVTLTLQNNYQFAVDFERDGMPDLLVDETSPLGSNLGPNPTRLLAAAIGQCVGSSLLFCLRKSRIEVRQLRTRVAGSVTRNARGRLRLGPIQVTLEPDVAPEMIARMGRCIELFEDFCLVTESVREGLDVRVSVAAAEVEVPT